MYDIRCLGSDNCWHAGLLGLKTLVFKLLGVTLSMAGGLIAGKEGPSSTQVCHLQGRLLLLLQMKEKSHDIFSA